MEQSLQVVAVLLWELWHIWVQFISFLLALYLMIIFSVQTDSHYLCFCLWSVVHSLDSNQAILLARHVSFCVNKHPISSPHAVIASRPKGDWAK